MSKEQKVTNMWKVFEDSGFVSDPESKETSITCDELDRSVKDDQAVLDIMITFSHTLSCDKCRTKYRKKKEDQ